MPDGMKCDQRGNIWVTAPGGVWVYAPAGDLLGKVRVPELVANLAWGGPDFRTLYLTATHSVYRVADQGRAAPRALHDAGAATAAAPSATAERAPASASAPPSSRPRTCSSIRAAAR